MRLGNAIHLFPIMKAYNLTSFPKCKILCLNHDCKFQSSKLISILLDSSSKGTPRQGSFPYTTRVLLIVKSFQLENTFVLLDWGLFLITLSKAFWLYYSCKTRAFITISGILWASLSEQGYVNPKIKGCSCILKERFLFIGNLSSWLGLTQQSLNYLPLIL